MGNGIWQSDGIFRRFLAHSAVLGKASSSAAVSTPIIHILLYAKVVDGATHDLLRRLDYAARQSAPGVLPVFCSSSIASAFITNACHQPSRIATFFCVRKAFGFVVYSLFVRTVRDHTCTAVHVDVCKHVKPPYGTRSTSSVPNSSHIRSTCCRKSDSVGAVRRISRYSCTAVSMPLSHNGDRGRGMGADAAR